MKPEYDPHSVPLTSLKMDDFNTLGFGGGHHSYAAPSGNEWMESLIIGDLQPCESTESSSLPPVVMVDSWENDFTLPRDLRVRVSIENATAMAELQQKEYQLQQQQQQIAAAVTPVAAAGPSEERVNPSRKDVSEAEDRSTESDYSDKDHSVHLVHLLLECATQLERNHQSTLSLLRRLRDLSSPFGDPMQRGTLDAINLINLLVFSILLIDIRCLFVVSFSCGLLLRRFDETSGGRGRDRPVECTGSALQLVRGMPSAQRSLSVYEIRALNCEPSHFGGSQRQRVRAHHRLRDHTRNSMGSFNTSVRLATKEARTSSKAKDHRYQHIRLSPPHRQASALLR